MTLSSSSLSADAGLVCGCPCGAVEYTVHGAPLLRGYCHCTICQSFNQAPFSDITVFHADDVALPDEASVDYRTFRPPPAVQRGVCRACGKPAVEYIKLPLMPKLIVVPSLNIRQLERIPAPALHVFYHRRQADVADALPKYQGYLASQTAFLGRIALRLRRR